MAFIPEYKYDIFVSYASANDQASPDVDNGWVTILLNKLKKLLDQKLGVADGCSLWMQHEFGTDYSSLQITSSDRTCKDSFYTGKEKRLRQKIADLQKQWDLVNEKLTRLKLEKDLATSTEEKFKLEKMIEGIEVDYKKIEQSLCELESGEFPLKVNKCEVPTNGNNDKVIIPEIVKDVCNSAIVIIILSREYLASPWCNRETTNFLDVIQKHSGVESQVFVVEREKIAYDERPPEFADSPNYPFWTEEEAGKPGRILDTGDLRYHNRLDELSRDLQKTLQQFKRPPITGHKEPSKASDSNPVVFLALNFDDLRRSRKEVETNLVQSNVRVLPEKDYPSEPRAFREAVRADLAQSDVFVQLLSDDPGWNPPDLPEGFARCQYDLAREMGIDIVQWRSPALDLESIQNPKLRDFLGLNTVSCEVVEEFQRKIIETAFQKTSSPQKENALFVFVDAHERDAPLTQKIERVLKEYGADYALPPRSQDPGENEEIFRKLVLHCDVLILVYGNVAPNWVYGQALNIRKIKAFREHKHRLSSAVYIGPPPKPEITLKFPWLPILECQKKDFDEWQLRNFIKSRSGGRV